MAKYIIINKNNRGEEIAMAKYSELTKAQIGIKCLCALEALDILENVLESSPEKMGKEWYPLGYFTRYFLNKQIKGGVGFSQMIAHSSPKKCPIKIGRNKTWTRVHVSTNNYIEGNSRYFSEYIIKRED